MNIFEFVLKLKGYNLSDAEKKIKYLQSLNKNDFINWQNNEKWKIVRHHYNKNQLYKEKIGPIFPDKWDDIPIMEKQDFQGKFLNSLSSGYSKKDCYVANTSGSTGTPLIFAKNITLVVADCCTPPPVRLAAHCVATGSLIAASVVSPNPVTIGSAIHVVTEIYDNC